MFNIIFNYDKIMFKLISLYSQLICTDMCPSSPMPHLHLHTTSYTPPHHPYIPPLPLLHLHTTSYTPPPPPLYIPYAPPTPPPTPPPKPPPSAGPRSWLVRPSDSCLVDYSLFFYCDQQVQRFRIKRQNNQYYMGGRIFHRFYELEY